jgi:hypothetical protein
MGTVPGAPRPRFLLMPAAGLLKPFGAGGLGLFYPLFAQLFTEGIILAI